MRKKRRSLTSKVKHSHDKKSLRYWKLVIYANRQGDWEYCNYLIRLWELQKLTKWQENLKKSHTATFNWNYNNYRGGLLARTIGDRGLLKIKVK